MRVVDVVGMFQQRVQTHQSYIIQINVKKNIRYSHVNQINGKQSKARHTCTIGKSSETLNQYDTSICLFRYRGYRGTPLGGVTQHLLMDTHIMEVEYRREMSYWEYAGLFQCITLYRQIQDRLWCVAGVCLPVLEVEKSFYLPGTASEFQAEPFELRESVKLQIEI